MLHLFCHPIWESTIGLFLQITRVLKAETHLITLIRRGRSFLQVGMWKYLVWQIETFLPTACNS